MDELKNNIRLVLTEIDKVSDYLYQQKVNKAYESLNGLLGNIMDLTDRLFSLSKAGMLQFDSQNLLGSLTGAMEAMEEKDSVLLADILVYEIAGQLRGLEL